MALLRGFPASSTVGPGIYIKETDLSLILPAPTNHRAGIVGFASKGPINKPTVITSRRDLHRQFGYPHPAESDPYLIYAAEQYLFVANEAVIVRCGDDGVVSGDSAQVATVDIDSNGTIVQIESDTTGPYTFSDDSFFRWKLNGNLASKTLVVTADTYTVYELVDELNDQLDTSIDGIEFYTTSATTIGVQTTFSYGPDAELELVSVQSAIYGGSVVSGNITGLGTGMTQAAVTGYKNRYPATAYQTEGTYDFTGLTGLNLQIIIEGTDNALIDDITQVIDLADLEGLSVTANQICNEINQNALGFTASNSGGNITLTTDAHGRDSKILVKSASTADGVFGFLNETGTGESPLGVTGDSDIETVGRATGDSASGVSFTIDADSAGIEGNNTQVQVTNDARTGTFSIQVYSNGSQVEAWGGLTKDETSRFYVESYLSLVSDYIRATDNTSNPASPVDGVYSLSGGTDGIPPDPDDQDDLLIGNDVAMTGLQAMSDPEQIDLDLVIIPGHTSTNVVQALINFCQDTRGDCFAIIDTPFGLTVNEVVDWQNGVHPLNLTRFDSDFAAIYWPWVKFRDTTNKVDVWAPPSGAVLAAYAHSDDLSAPWEAPAGLTRGIVSNISDVFSRPSADERKSMYGNRNAVNPILQFIDTTDFVIFGQKTLQRRPTALDRVNVRRMMISLEKQIKQKVRTLLFEPHDEVLRQQFVNIATQVLEEIKGARGVTDYRVQCDAELNPPDVIDRNELHARIGVQPTRAVEFIFIDFSLHRTGSFEENADSF